LLISSIIKFKLKKNTTLAYWGLGLNVFASVLFIAVTISRNHIFTEYLDKPSNIINLSLISYLLPILAVAAIILLALRPVTAANTVNWAIAGVAGSMTNTLLVMHLIYIFFGEDWNNARGPVDVIYTAILGIITMNGVPEAIVAGILVAAVMGALSVVVK
jgi:uncharacterized membrane protein